MSNVKLFAALAAVHAQLLAQPGVIRAHRFKVVDAEKELKEEEETLVTLQKEFKRLNEVASAQVEEKTETWVAQVQKEENLLEKVPQVKTIVAPMPPVHGTSKKPVNRRSMNGHAKA